MRPGPDGRLPEGNWPWATPHVSEVAVRLLDEERLVEAEQVFRAQLSVQEVSLPTGHWRTAQTMSSLGAALTGRMKFAEAEATLLGAYEQLKDNADAPADVIRVTLERLVRLYESREAVEANAGHAEQAARWRQLIFELTSQGEDQ